MLLSYFLLGEYFLECENKRHLHFLLQRMQYISRYGIMLILKILDLL